MAVGYYRTGGAVGLADDLTIGKAGNTILGRKDTQTEFRSATAKFHPTPLASQTLSPALAASTNVTATVYSWAKTWGGSSDDGANHVAVDGSGNLYVAGDFVGTVDFDPNPVKTDIHTSHKGTIDAYLSKFDSTGAFQWARTWGGAPAGTPQNAFDGRDTAYGVGVDSLGNVYVVGPYRYTVDFNPDPTITEITPPMRIPRITSISASLRRRNLPVGANLGAATTGRRRRLYRSRVWELSICGRRFPGRRDFNPWGEPDVHLNHGTAPYGFDAFLSKFDLNGNFQWAKTWGGEGYDDGPGVAVDGAGNVYVAGMYASQTINFDPAGGSGGLGHPAHDSGILVDVFLSKFDSSGNFQWVRTWGGQGTDDAMGSVAVDGANNVYVAGRFASINCDFNPGAATDLHSSNGDLDAFLSKFDSNGTFQWAKTWGGSGGDKATGLAVDGVGHVYVSGRFHDTVDFDPGSGVDNHTSNGQYDIFLSQFDSSGNFNWAKTWGGSGDDISGVTVDGSGNVYAAGGFVGLVDFDRAAELITTRRLAEATPSSANSSHPSNCGGRPAVPDDLPELERERHPARHRHLDDKLHGGPGSPASPIAGLVDPTRAYAITNATNYIWYDMTLNAMVDGSAVLTDTVRVMPTKFVYLPLVRR